MYTYSFIQLFILVCLTPNLTCIHKLFQIFKCYLISYINYAIYKEHKKL